MVSTSMLSSPVEEYSVEQISPKRDEFSHGGQFDLLVVVVGQDYQVTQVARLAHNQFRDHLHVYEHRSVYTLHT